MTFDQIHIPEGADEAMEWACVHEFDLRHQHMRRSEIGLVGVLRETALVFGQLNEALRGDPSLGD